MVSAVAVSRLIHNQAEDHDDDVRRRSLLQKHMLREQRIKKTDMLADISHKRTCEVTQLSQNHHWYQKSASEQ